MEVAAVVGHGDGGCRLLATAREVVELFAPLDGIEVFHNVEREREREREREIKGRKKKLWVQGLFVVVS